MWVYCGKNVDLDVTRTPTVSVVCRVDITVTATVEV